MPPGSGGRMEGSMKKRLVAALMASVMTVGALTGCAAKKDTNGSAVSGEVDENGVTKDDITLTYWHYEDETTINLLAEAFMKKYPNIKVECKQISDMSTDLSAAANSGTFPDVFSGTDSDTALANEYWLDITDYVENDPDMANMMTTIKDYGIGKFDTSRWFGLPTWYQPSAIFIDRNVISKLNLEMPRTDWTWDEMLQLIKDATVDDRSGMKYYGLGYYNRLDSLYGIAACSTAERAIKGEFGFDGTDFDLQYWAIGEQQFSDLKLAGYVAPQQNTQAMEDNFLPAIHIEYSDLSDTVFYRCEVHCPEAPPLLQHSGPYVLPHLPGAPADADFPCECSESSQDCPYQTRKSVRFRRQHPQ